MGAPWDPLDFKENKRTQQSFAPFLGHGFVVCNFVGMDTGLRIQHNSPLFSWLVSKISHTFNGIILKCCEFTKLLPRLNLTKHHGIRCHPIALAKIRNSIRLISRLILSLWEITANKQHVSTQVGSERIIDSIPMIKFLKCRNHWPQMGIPLDLGLASGISRHFWVMFSLFAISPTWRLELRIPYNLLSLSWLFPSSMIIQQNLEQRIADQ